jgi:hypothetical protein
VSQAAQEKQKQAQAAQAAKDAEFQALQVSEHVVCIGVINMGL